MSLAPKAKYNLLKNAGYSGELRAGGLAGVTGEIGQMKECQERCKKFDALGKEVGASLSKEHEEKFILAFAEKWKADPTIYDKIEKDLAANPAAAEKIKEMVKKDPDAFLVSLKDYKGGNLDAVLNGVNKGAAPAPTNPATQPSAPPAAAPAAAPASSAPPATQPAAPATPAPATNNNDIDPIKLMTELAAASDDDIKHLDKEAVKGILLGMADNAAQLGVQQSTIDGFKTKIEKNEHELVENITENWQNNPEFVRELAKASLKALKNPKKPGEKPDPAATTAMTDVMENPDHLADDKYVKKLASNMKLADSALGQLMSGLSKGFGDFFSGLAGKLGQAFKQIVGWFSDMFGGDGMRSAISMKNGKGFLPDVMINMGIMHENANIREAEARARPSDMRPYPIVGEDGKMFHDEKQKVKDPKTGEEKEVVKSVPNTITVKDVDGKEHKWIPADGLKAAKMSDGNYRVTGVTAITPEGIPKAIDSITMTPADFKAYKEQIEEKSKQEYGVSGNNSPSMRVTPINPANGLVGDAEIVGPKANSDGVEIFTIPEDKPIIGVTKMAPKEPRPSAVGV